jgi:hypothetical protein
MENVDIFYDHLEYFTAVGYNLWPFWYSLWSFSIFFPIWYVWTKKKFGNPARVAVFKRVFIPTGTTEAQRFQARPLKKLSSGTEVLST